ncbi:MAG TPA: MlaD family protein [Candidatus Binataceae bacterium]|nr:MlaD family protein [Candidatus Binataceae bacterium]
MGKRISPTAIGIFVMGSLALLLAALVVLGSGRLFRPQHLYICFFQGNLNGLKVGAAVKVRGVQIGSVQRILLRLPPEFGHVKASIALRRLPVIIDVDEAQLINQGASGEALQKAGFDSLIKRGLRAQLNTESLLTGLVYVDLDLHPSSQPVFALEPGSGPYPEIPTVPTDLEQVQETAMRALAKLDKIDFNALVKALTNAADSANQLISSPDVKGAVASLRDTAVNLNNTVVLVQKEIASLNQKTDPLIASMKKTSDDADQAMLQAKATMATLQTSVAPDSTLRYRLDVALDDVSEASSAIRQLADLLQRNPSVLVRGRYVPDNHQ